MGAMTGQFSEQSVFLHAIGLPSPAERAAYLDSVCQDEPRLRAELEALLAAHDRLGGSPSHLTSEMRPANDATLGGEYVGVFIGPYKLLEPIGEGGMGAVYMAEQTEPVKRLVALKLIKTGM